MARLSTIAALYALLAFVALWVRFGNRQIPAHNRVPFDDRNIHTHVPIKTSAPVEPYGTNFQQLRCIENSKTTAKDYLALAGVRDVTAHDWTTTRRLIDERTLRSFRAGNSEHSRDVAARYCTVCPARHAPLLHLPLKVVAADTSRSQAFEENLRSWQRPPSHFQEGGCDHIVILRDAFVGPGEVRPGVPLASRTSIFDAQYFLDDGRQKRPAQLALHESLPVKRLEHRVIATTNWPLNTLSNYYHFVREALACVVKMRYLLDQIPGLQLLVPQTRGSFVWQFYRLLFSQGQLREVLVPFETSRTYSIATLLWLTPPTPQLTSLDARLLRSTFVGHAHYFPQQHLPSPKRDQVIVIDRSKAGRRRILNHAALMLAVREAVRETPYRVVSFSHATVREQIEMFARAALVIAPHGAGEINMLWTHPLTPLIEIGPWSGKGASLTFNSCFWDMCDQRGSPFFFVPVNVGDAPSKAYIVENMMVPVSDVKVAVNEALLGQGNHVPRRQD